MEAREETLRRIDVKHVSAMFLAVLTLLAVSPVASYGGDGNLTLAAPPPPTTGICNDGSDNDGDGLTDGEDPGCTKPFALDRSEYDMRDFDLSYNLYDNTPPDSDDLTPLVPGFTKTNYLSSSPDAGGPGQNEIWEAYIDQLGYAQWAGGEEKFERMAVAGTVAGSPGFREGDAVINEPVSESFPFDDSGVETCGNGDREMDEGDNLGCPQDFGFADDLMTDDGSRTQDQSTSDITDELGPFEVNVGTNYYPWDVTQSDPPNYTMDMFGIEPMGDPSSSAIDADINIQSPGGDPPSEKVYEHFGISDAPDYFPSDRKLRLVYLHASPQEIDTVKDYDLEGYNDDLTHYVLPPSNERKSITRGCFPSADAEGRECEYSDQEYCVANIENHAKNYSLKEDTVTLNQNTKMYSTRQPDSENGKPWHEGGYEKVTTNHELTVEVTRDVSDGYELVDAYNCNNWVSESSCEVKDGVDNPNGTCIETSSDFVYEDASPDYNGVRPGKVNRVVDGGSISVKYEAMEYRTRTVFSTVYSENEGLESEVSSKKALFDGDYPLEDIMHKGPYYSAEQDIPSRDFANHPAFSASSFEIVAQDGTFHSKRDYYGVWNVDGTNGFGDSFVAIKEGDIENENGPFLNETSIEVGSGGNPGYIDANENVNFVTPSDYSAPSCPGRSIFCVSAADVSVKPWDDWASGNSPEFEIETIDTVNVSESWGACRKYQELIGGARESILRCQYDWDDDFPSGPTPFWEPPVVGGEN